MSEYTQGFRALSKLSADPAVLLRAQRLATLCIRLVCMAPLLLADLLYG